MSGRNFRKKNDTFLSFNCLFFDDRVFIYKQQIIMIKTRKDGSTYYYYYKKKIGCHKKTGKKPILLPDGSPGTYNFHYKYTRKFDRLSEFVKEEPIKYVYCVEKGWLDKLFPFVCRYTQEKCKELCFEYDGSEELLDTDKELYDYLVSRNWLNKVFSNVQEQYMKSKCIYKIDYSTMSIVDKFKKISDITSDKNIYRVLRGEKVVYDDGYMYRKDCDIEIDQNTGKVVDKLRAKTKDEKKYMKYEYVINLLKNTSLSLSEICRESNLHGCKISEPTCRELKQKYCGNLD